MQRFDPAPIPISYDNRMPEGRKAFVGQPNLLVFQGLCTSWISCVSPFVVCLCTHCIPRWRVRPLGNLTLTLSLSRFAPDLGATMSWARP
jgi:hypothetical protein